MPPTKSANDESAAAKPPTKEESNENEEDNGPGETDLVMRDGFPALRIPGTKWKPMVDGDEPIPRHPFWAGDDVIQFDPDHLETLRDDCKTVFTARDKPDGQAYSAGQTFFLPAKMKPRCALEGLVKEIFDKHTAHLEKGTFSLEHSGAEWWTLVMDSDKDDKPQPKEDAEQEEGDEDDEEDEVGLHFDADYELEEQASNILLHPRLGTVTYISNHGAPTLVLSKKSPPMDDVKKETLEKEIDKAWLSHPKLGKHIAFDGRLLHGAPALYFPSRKHSEDDEPKAKRQKVDTVRYTLLVNIWLNHWVLDAALLDDEVCSQLKTPWEETGGNLKGDDSYKPPFVWNDVDLGAAPTVPKHKLEPSTVDPAGEDEIALCNHNVTVKYNPTMAECHVASALAPTTELELEKGTITLHVGEELPSDDEEEGEQ